MADRSSIFMSMCYLLAESSEDPRTKIGAVIVGPKGDIKSSGWNGLPRGIRNTVSSRTLTPNKQYWFVHAELNAILNAGRNGISLKDCTIYCTAFPCHNCAQAIVQAGIVSVVYDLTLVGWEDSINAASQMFFESNITTSKYRGSYIDVKRHISGKVETLNEKLD